MHLGTHHRSPSRVAMRLLLLLALAAASLTLTHCRMVGDRLTGLRVSPLRRSETCLKKCRDTFKDASKAEERLHDTLIDGCHGDATCIQVENQRHEAAEDAIEQAYRACRNGCHDQGGGRDDD